jgi:hypothetical protein
VNLIGGTRTEAGLVVTAEIDENDYPVGTLVTDKQMKLINIRRDDFRGEWNYTISPRARLSV